jgi:hypothetical protein
MSRFRARVESVYMHDGVKIAVADDHVVYIWPTSMTVRERSEATAVVADDDIWLRIDEDAARAMYEALAGYFGGAGHDTRALRKDYDAERARVDLMIGHLTTKPVRR